MQKASKWCGNSLLVVAGALLVAAARLLLVSTAALAAFLAVLLVAGALLLVLFAAWAAALAVGLVGALWAALVFRNLRIHGDDEVECGRKLVRLAKIRAFGYIPVECR